MTGGANSMDRTRRKQTEEEPPFKERVPSTPSPRSGRGLGLLLSGLGLLYLVYPSAGLLELIPDILPVVGNLDEAAATGLLLYGLRRMGIDLLARKRVNE